jgi:hypothetical protein
VKWQGRVTWVVGGLGAILALGPAVTAPAILRLDFVLLPHAPVPSGVWGLGTELPRRTPLLLPLAWADSTVGSVTAGKVLVVASLAAAFVGATRLAGRMEWPWRWAAGLLYALGPFALTRLAVGHLFVLAAMAVLPWALPTLLDPHRDRRLTFLAGLALALTGVLGGVFALVLAFAGAVGRRWQDALRSLAAVAVAQLVWLAPGLVVAWHGTAGASSRGFRTDLSGEGGPLRLLAGHGFWQPPFQVGSGQTWAVPGLGLAVLGLAVAGHRRLPPWRGRAAAVAAGAVVLALLSGFSGTAGLYEWLTALPGGAAIREGQRVLPLALVWMAPAAANGAQALVAWRPRWPFLEASAVVCGALLCAPVLWGAGGQLEAAEIPDGWEDARQIVTTHPGPVLALPWLQYIELDAAGGAGVLNPLPLWLGGDVLVSSDPRLEGETGLERNDPRERAAAQIAAASLRGEAVGERLANLGVRWVVALRDGEPVRGVPAGVLAADALAEDPSLQRVLAGRAIEVYAVRAWRGHVVAQGDPVPVDPVIAPWLRVGDAPERIEVGRPWAAGWMRGFEPAEPSDNGLLRFDSGDGPIWYWPAVLLLLVYSSLGAIAVLVIRSHWSSSH